MWGGVVATNGTALAQITGVWRYERHDKDSTADLAHHEPVSRRLGRIKERVRAPHVIDVLDPEGGVLKQMRGLVVDLERLLIVEPSRSNNSATDRVYYKRIRTDRDTAPLQAI